MHTNLCSSVSGQICSKFLCPKLKTYIYRWKKEEECLCREPPWCSTVSQTWQKWSLAQHITVHSNTTHKTLTYSALHYVWPGVSDETATIWSLTWSTSTLPPAGSQRMNFQVSREGGREGSQLLWPPVECHCHFIHWLSPLLIWSQK